MGNEASLQLGHSAKALYLWEWKLSDLHKIHQAIEICPVKCSDLQRRLGKQHDEWSVQGCLQRLSERAIRPLVFCMQLGVSRLLPHPSCLDEEYFRSVCFAEEEDGENLDQGVGD